MANQRRVTSSNQPRDVSIADDCCPEFHVGIKPLVLAHRVFDPVVGLVVPEEARIIGREQHDGHSCVVIETGHGRTPDLRRWRGWLRLWLAEHMGYSVVRSQALKRTPGNVVQEIQLKYRTHETLGWCLRSWDDGPFTSEGQSRGGAHTVVVAARFNVPVAPATFEIPTPVGTRVNDQRIKLSYTVAAGPESGSTPLDVSGTVVDSEGAPVAGADVVAVAVGSDATGKPRAYSRRARPPQNAVVREVKADATGSFTVRGLPAGTVIVGVHVPSRIHAWGKTECVAGERDVRISIFWGGSAADQARGEELRKLIAEYGPWGPPDAE